MLLVRLLTLVGLVQLVTATTDLQITLCFGSESTNYRSLWSILLSCALTLIICVWHAVHPPFPLPSHRKWIHVFLYRVYLIGFAFFVPELLMARACNEWCVAKEITKRFQDAGYVWWSRSHSYFVIMGGFVLHDKTGVREIDDEELLKLLEQKSILNPVVAKDDLMEKSASDGLAKAILGIQLIWFGTQLIVRDVYSYAVTLVELDTFCIAVSTLPLLVFWWDKPCSPRRPYVFYAIDLNDSDESQEKLDVQNKAKGPQEIPKTTTRRCWRDLLRLTTKESISRYPFYLVFLAWSLFGALHIIAWRYQFPTPLEQNLWRLASLILAGSPLVFFPIGMIAYWSGAPSWLQYIRRGLTYSVAGVVRAYLVVGMLASLRHLPHSAYETVSYLNYIPHL